MKRLVFAALVWVSGFAHADYASVYTANLTTADVTNDFTYAQVGNIGNVTSTHSLIGFTNGSALRFSARYTGKPSLRLKTIHVASSLKVDFSFKLYNTVTSETMVALGWRMKTNQTANTYPLYYVSLERCATNGALSRIQLVKKWESATNYQTVLANYDYWPTALINTSVFSWSITSAITKTNQFGDTLGISVYVTNNGTPFCSLVVTSNPQLSDGYSSVVYNPTNGGIGVVGGGMNNNGTFVGMDLLGLTISEDTVRPVSTPEFTWAGVGNSFTFYNNSYPYILYDVAAAAGHAIQTGLRAFPGRTLHGHCTEINDGSTTPVWLSTNRYDYYGINELSFNTQTTQGLFHADWRTNQYPFYLDRMITTIQSNHPSAKIGLYENWAAKSNILAMTGFNSQPVLTTLFTNLAARYTNVFVMPFGRAMQRVHLQHPNPDPPQITVSIPPTVGRSNEVSFSASATDNGTITNFLWAFGDGTFTNGPGLTNVTHRYTMTNSCDVNVTVQDESGEWDRWGRIRDSLTSWEGPNPLRFGPGPWV